MKRSFFVLLALSVCGGGYLLADTKLDTKVISASGFEDSLADVGYNLFVLDGDELRERGYKDVKEALTSLPGISAISTGMGESIDIRGQGSRAVTHVRTFIDGVLINPEDTSHLVAPINSISIDDVEQIEVIPGGGSVVHGNGAMGGVVNIITKASLNKDYANVSLKGGSFSHKSANAGAGYRFNDNFYANFGINFIDEKGYQRADINKFFSTKLGLKYLLDNQSLALNLGFLQNKLRGSGALSKEEMDKDRRFEGTTTDMSTMPPKTISAKDVDPTKNTKKDISLKYQNDINEHFMLQINPYFSRYEFNDKAFIDNKIGAKINTKITYGISKTHLGYEFLYNKGERDSIAKNEVIKKSHSIYGLESLELNDTFNVDFGARYERASYDIDRSDTKGLIKYSDSKSNNAWAANLVFGAKINDENKVYTKIERGYTLPGAYELTDKDANGYKTNNLKPESYISYELGYKGLLAEQFFSATAFYTQTKDEIFHSFLTFLPTPTWVYQNISKTERYGIELAANQSFLDDNLNIYENLSYIKAKVKDDRLHPARKGEQIPQVSPFKATIGASYLMFDVFKIRGDYNYFSKSKWYFDDEFGKGRMGAQVVPLSENDKKAYGLLNLGLSYYPIKNLDINFDVKNVLGEKYNLSCGKDGKCNPAAKQSFYLEARYTF